MAGKVLMKEKMRTIDERESTKYNRERLCPQMSSDVFHCLSIEQYDRKFLVDICELATAIRVLSKSKKGADQLATVLSHKRAMLYFVQPSTRTFLSFQSACQILGMKTADVRDTNTSSEVKGESEADTVRTFSSYYDNGLAEDAVQTAFLNLTKKVYKIDD
ncbi:MAG: hypothetical protein Q7J85_01760, partial [Bacillota bacterium]|nr:hypothetical protein [Bacillota bacterium]